MTIFWLLVLISVLFLVALYLAARNDWHATFVPEGMIKFIVQGDSLNKILPNVRDIVLNPDGTLIRVPGGQEAGLLTGAILGIYWVSALFPFRRVHSFSIDAATLRNEKDRAGKSPDEWIEHQPKVVNGLRWRFPRPLLLKEVELQDRIQIDLVIYTIYEVVDPYIPVFLYKGKFFEQLDAALEGRAISFFNDQGYREFVDSDWGKGDGALWQHLSTINHGNIDTPEGIIQTFGIRAVESWVVFYDLSEGDQETRDAAKAEEREALLAAGVEARAKGEANAKRTVAVAEGERGRLFIDGLIEKGVDPNIAAEIYRTQVRMENIRDSDLTTLVEGGGNAVPTIQVAPGGGRN